ncbi:hypothetical protein AZE42_12808, partial [Rhizopogon vesiculosus]
DTTFNEAAILLKNRFPNQFGGEKTQSTCASKWQNLKTAYGVVLDIKNSSGFMWSDEHGAGVFQKDDDIWNHYAKNRRGVNPFKNKGFKHFYTIEQMMPKISKGSHVYRVPAMPRPIGGTSGTGIPQPEATVRPSHPPQPEALTLGQLTSVTHEIISNTAHSAQAGASTGGLMALASAVFSDPSSITPSTPSSFLASGSSAASVSASSSMLMSAQKDGNDTMRELTVHIKDFLITQTQAATSTQSSQDGPLGRAIVLLSEYRDKTLTLDDYLEIVDYFGRDKAQAVIFSNLPLEPMV